MSRTKNAARKGNPPGPRTLAKHDRNAALHAKAAKSALIEGTDPKLTEASNDEEEGGVDVAPSESTVTRKRDHDEFESDADKQSAGPPAAKKKYKSKAERKAASAKPADDGDIGTGDDFDSDMAQMDSILLADHVAKTIKRHYKKDTTIELDEKYLPTSTFTNTTEFKEPRQKNTLGPFLEFLVAGDKTQLTSAAKETARPHTIVLCQSGIRAADLTRVLRPYETDGNAVVKLFAKHFKIGQQAVFMRKNKTGFGVGTPHRVKGLITTGGLKLDNLTRIVIDGSYLDEKKLGIWGFKEIFEAMLEILKLDVVRGKIDAGDLKVVVF